jgi:subtilisin family serine protease
MKTKLLSIAILALLLVAVCPIQMIRADQPNIHNATSSALGFDVQPYKVEPMTCTTGTSVPGAVPFNVDMTDAENVKETGDGIYVAVLDTGLLSNYRYFFPADKVKIKTDWGIGFTHDLIWVGSGGNWSNEFDYGPLRSDRGFITHDNGAPDQYGFGWGSGHGTQVTSEVTGWWCDRHALVPSDPTAPFWVRGVAPKVTIIPVLVLDDWIAFNPDFSEGWFFTGGTDEMVAAGIQYIGDLAQAHHIKIVINMSLGGPTPTQIIEDAIDYAIARGVIIVASAGNEGEAGMGYPGAYPQVISVAAAGWTQEYGRYATGTANPWYWWLDDVPENLWTTDYLGNKFQVYLTDFSSRPNATLGQHIWDLDVAACGAGVKGPYKGYGSGQWGYYSVWGTSQAAPHVAAIAALVLQDYPRLDQCSMQLLLKLAGAFNPLTKLFEKDRSALVYDTFSGTIVTYTWTWKDYGTGLLQADDAVSLARLLFGNFKGKFGWC